MIEHTKRHRPPTTFIPPPWLILLPMQINDNEQRTEQATDYFPHQLKMRNLGSFVALQIDQPRTDDCKLSYQSTHLTRPSFGRKAGYQMRRMRRHVYPGKNIGVGKRIQYSNQFLFIVYVKRPSIHALL